MGRRSARGDITRHYDIDARPTDDQVRRVRSLAADRQLPERGGAASIGRMLDSIEAVCQGGGTAYEANKLYDWMRRFPRRAAAAKVDPWQDWDPARLEEIAEVVLMRGRTPHRAAIEYGTTTETVDAIVAAYKMRLMRGEL